ncbi:MAG: 3-phosphoshikimate 1-carboxyvinyltransferase [Nitrospiraceae bacterium]|nr:3-phosphoshikimate 1-carboxyvinyltransferase [Nitrospiraceae bacterium]
MDSVQISPAMSLRGEFSSPPDKSISHRAVMFSSLAKGRSVVKNFLRAQDTESTMNAFRSLGVQIEDRGDTLLIDSRGLRGLTEAHDVIDCGNSGTTIRLISGVLAGNPFFSVLTGDKSLRSRPMGRVIKPLSLMGADISARAEDRYPPLAIRGGRLNGIAYEMPIASAQVKSSVILAGLYAEGETVVVEPAKSRDHTERMLPAFGADLVVDGLTVRVRPGSELLARDTEVPGDFSSAAFFITAALITGGSEILARNVGMNPTRTGLLHALGKMGAEVTILNMREVSGEPVADILCRGGSRLRATDITGEEIPALIDEFPVLCVAAAYAEGTTTIRGAGELRVKESDRIASMASELGKMGAAVEEFPDGLSITGADSLKGAVVESHGDHRIAMSMAVAGLAAQGTTTINGAAAVGISFPSFFDIIRRLST